MNLKLSIVWLLAVAAVALSVSGAPASESEIAPATAPKQAMRVGFSPAKLFDFNNYKTFFHKTYSGLLEELVRGKYFLSRAFRAFISAIEYKYRKSPYYLAVNPMSDWTPEEIKRSENKIIAQESYADTEQVVSASNKQTSEDTELPELLPNDVGEVEKELKKMADSATAGQPGYDELKRVIGESVATSSTGPQSANLRDLPLDKLIDTGADARLSAEAASKVVKRVPSNNADYVPIELPSFGLADEQKEVSFSFMEFPGDAASSFASSLTNAFNGIKSGAPSAGKRLADEVFVDLRDTNCFTIPRDQGDCGACYAFAAVSIFEWMYCMKTGKLVEFSEQYLVDCGSPYVKRMDGCGGGNSLGIANFVKNFGLELSANYPYTAQTNLCPYEPSTNPKNTGYIRFDLENILAIPLEMAPQQLKNGPLYITISTGPVFHEYGGGVIGKGCPQKASTHSVVLLGHGREDGEEYWLIRNSQSVSWGEGGYGRLSKSAGCIFPENGVVFGSRDGTLEGNFKQNELNDHQVVENRMERINNIGSGISFSNWF